MTASVVIHNVKLGVRFLSLLPPVRGRAFDKSSSLFAQGPFQNFFADDDIDDDTSALPASIKYGSDGNDQRLFFRATWEICLNSWGS